MVMLAGFLGILTVFMKTNPIVKIVAVGGFVNCFFSFAPFLSFVSYFSLIAACYFYILCSHVTDWRPVIKSLQALLILHSVVIFFQVIGKDPVLNFGLEKAEYMGVVGQTMQSASMIVILCAFLISFSRFNVIIPIIIAFPCNSAWALLCGFAGWMAFVSKKYRPSLKLFAPIAICIFLIFALITGKFAHNFNKIGRVGVWAKSMSLANQRPLTGYGIGSFKFLFPIKSDMPTSKPWRTAHNSVVQIYFEAGILAAILMVGTFAFLAIKLYALNLINCFAGLVMIGLDSLVHFPDRMIQAVLILIAFFAFCEFKIRERSYGR